jgi:hypothetical protein
MVNTAGITGVVDPRVSAIAKQLEETGMFKPTALTPASIEKQRAMLRGLPGMAATDYQKQLQESKDLSKLNLLLGIAKAGFDYAGAPRQRGEGEFSVASRALLSPLLPQVSKFATDVKSAELAAAKAKRDEERALTQGALTLQQTEAARLDKARDKRQTLAFSLAEKDFKPIGKGWQYKAADGKFKSFYGFQVTNKQTNEVETYRIDKDGNTVLITSAIEEAPDVTKRLKPQVSDTGYVTDTQGREQRATRIYDPNNDTIKVVLTDGMGVVRTSGENPPYKWSRSDPTSGSKGKITSVKKTAQFLTKGPDGKRKLRSVPVERLQRDDPGTLQRVFGPQLFPVNSEISIQVDHPTEKDKDGKPLKINPVEGVHFTLSPFDNLSTPTTEKFYLRKDLSEAELRTAQRKLGKVRPGELVSRRVYRDKNTEQVRLSQYDAQGKITGLTPDEANKWLTVKSDQDDGKGKVLSKSPVELTVDGKPRQVVLYEFGPGDIDFFDLETKKRLASGKAKGAYKSIPEDKLFQTLKPVFERDFKKAIAARQDLDPDTLAQLNKQTLSTADLKKLSGVSQRKGDLTQVISDMVSSRVTALQKKKPPSAVPQIPQSVSQRYPRIGTLTSQSGFKQGPLVPPALFQPWRKGAEVKSDRRVMLGTGSHPGFKSVTEGSIDKASRNWPSIKADIENFYPGLVVDNREEEIIAFTELWKHLPSMSKAEKTVTYTPKQWRSAFDKAAQQYDAAGGTWKDANDIEAGLKGRSLQKMLDTNADAMRNNALMSRYQDQGGAFQLTGNWLAEFRGTGLGELWEWATIDGKNVQVPTTKWGKYLKPDSQLSSSERAIKKNAIEIFNKFQKEGSPRIGTNEFERAAEYLAGLARYRISAFDMIPDARPSDKDIEIFLKAFVGDRDSKTVIFQRLSELQNTHANEASRLINNYLNKAAFSADTVVNLDHTARALDRAAVRDPDPSLGKRAQQFSENYRRAASKYRMAANKIAGKIIPGHRRGAVSPLSKTVDEETTANLYNRLQAAALQVFPNESPKDAIQKFLDAGYNLVEFRGSFEMGKTPSAVRGVIESDGSVTLR